MWLDGEDLGSGRLQQSPSSTERWGGSVRQDLVTAIPLQRPEDLLFAQQVQNLEGDVFGMASWFQQICDRCMDQIKEESSGSVELFQEARFKLLREERNTWKLLRDLEGDRVAFKQECESGVFQELERTGYITTKEMVDNLVRRDDQIRHSAVVLRWLESIAEEGVQYFRDQVYWANTLDAISKKSSDSVNEVDPDASTRQFKRLHPDDEEDEERVLKAVWTLVKAGKVQEASDMCRDVGQYWRAATLLGDTPHHIDFKEGVVRGNEFRNVWKKSCWELSKQVRSYNEYECAIFGALSGNLDAMLPLCSTFHEKLWAHYKVMLEGKVQMQLYRSVRKEHSEDCSEIVCAVDRRPEEVFAILKPEYGNTSGFRGEEFYHLIQEKIILGKTDELLLQLAEWISTRKTSLPIEILRFAAHIVLFIFEGRIPPVEQMNPIIDASQLIMTSYIEHLVRTNQHSLIALYTATLHPAFQVVTYAKFIKNVKERERRAQCLVEADRENLDVSKIATEVVKMINEEHGKWKWQDWGMSEASEEVWECIQAIEWLTFDPAHRLLALEETNKITRQLIATRKIEPAQRLFDEVLPEDSVELVVERYGEDDKEVSNVIREYMSFHKYLLSLRYFREWHSNHVSMPRPPPPPSSTKYSDELAYNERLRVYTEEFETWQQRELEYTKQAADALMAVVEFPKGWLMDDDDLSPQYRNPEQQDRLNQLSALRKQCIPDAVFLFHKLLYQTRHFTESLQLSDIVANEHHKLYALFTREEMQNFLAAMRESALAILETNADPIGYTLVT